MSTTTLISIIWKLLCIIPPGHKILTSIINLSVRHDISPNLVIIISLRFSIYILQQSYALARVDERMDGHILPYNVLLSTGHNRETTDVLISDLLTLFLLAGMTHISFMISYIFSTICIQTDCLRVSPILPQND